MTPTEYHVNFVVGDMAEHYTYYITQMNVGYSEELPATTEYTKKIKEIGLHLVNKNWFICTSRYSGRKISKFDFHQSTFTNFKEGFSTPEEALKYLKDYILITGKVNALKNKGEKN